MSRIKFSKTILSAAAVIASASCQVITNPEIKPVPKDEIKVVAEVTADPLQKTRIESDLSVSWSETGESVKIVELASSTGRPSVAESDTREVYTLSQDRKTASFNFQLKKKDALNFSYLAVYPRLSYKETMEGDDMIIASIPSTQTPEYDSPGASAIVMGACTSPLTGQPESLKFDLEHIAAYGRMTLLNSPVSPDEKVEKVTIRVPSKKIAGGIQWNYSDGNVSATGSSNTDAITLNVTGLDINGTDDVWFSCIPFSLGTEDALTVTLSTDRTEYSQEVTFASGIIFERGTVSEFSVDMSGGETPEPTGIVSDSGVSDITTESAYLSASYHGVTADGRTQVAPDRLYVIYGTSRTELDNELESEDRASIGSGDYGIGLTSLTDNTTYYYQFRIDVGEKVFKSAVGSFTTETQSGGGKGIYYDRSWLAGYEIPDADVTLNSGAVNYNGRYCHRTVNEEHGNTKACIYNTSRTGQRIVTHTFEFDGKVKRTYTMLYDQGMRCALWCAFAMHKTEFPDKNVSRNDDWEFDPAIDESWQPDLSSAYTGNYSRGHQVASEDRQTSKLQNRQTFYFSNMTPQNQTLNGGVWNVLEQEVQKQGYSTTGRDTLYVVTGPIFKGAYKSTSDRTGKSCPIPTHYYKCTMKCSFDSSGKMTSASGAGYLFEHDANAKRQTVTIDKIEEMTGFDLFANVPENLQNAAERQ